MLEKLKKHKRIVATAMIIAATIVIELLFNYHALVDGYEPLDISDHIKCTQLEGKWRYQISYKAASDIYVRQIRLVGDYADECTYQINTSEINEFGKEKGKIYTDTASPWFSDYYTDINAKVKSLEISIPQMKETDQIRAVYLLNSFEINKYRVLFILITLVLLYFAIFEDFFARKTEWYFAVFAMTFGTLIILYGQSVPMGLDSQIHFGNVYSAAGGKNVEWSAAARAIVDKTTPQCNTKAEFAQLRPIMNEMGRQVLYTEKKDSSILPYSYVSYIPMILFLKLGMLLRLSFTSLYMLGKAGNLIFYVVLAFLAIRMARKQKLLLAFVTMMPTPVYLASTYSYDAFIIACVELGCVLWCNEMMYSEESTHKCSIIAMTILFTVGCFSKAVYVPLVLLVLVVPEIFESKVNRRIMWMGIFVLFALAMLTFVLPFLTNLATRNVVFGGDSRGGDTSAVGQAISMIKHPLASIRLMLASMLQWDNFNVPKVGMTTIANYFIGSNMLLDYGGLNGLPEVWNIILLPVITILFFNQEHSENVEKKMRNGQRIYGILVLLLVIGLIWLALYLSFSEVGENTIIGVQPRYFIPLIYLGAILFHNDKIVLKAPQNRIAKVMMTSLNAIWMFAVCGILLNGRLF